MQQHNSTMQQHPTMQQQRTTAMRKATGGFTSSCWGSSRSSQKAANSNQEENGISSSDNSRDMGSLRHAEQGTLKVSHICEGLLCLIYYHVFLELELYLLFICRISTEKNCASGPELPWWCWSNSRRLLWHCSTLLCYISLWSGLWNIDDWHKYQMSNNRNHLVGQLTNDTEALEWLSLKSFNCGWWVGSTHWLLVHYEQRKRTELFSELTNRLTTLFKWSNL